MQALLGRDMTVFGEGQQTRSFCYVNDVIEGFIRMMETGDEITGPINLGNPEELTIMQLAQLVIEITGSKSKIVRRPLPPDDPRQRRPDISQARSVLGWEPKISLREGLAKTIPFFERLLAEGLITKSAVTAR